MKKHILGVLIFVVIASATMFIFSLYKLTETNNLAEISVSDSYFPENSVLSPKIRQAIISPQNGMLSLEINYSEQNEKIRLRFYEKSSEGTNLIATENINLSNVAKKRGNITLYKSFDWIRDINLGKNIYVIADEDQSIEYSTSFDESKAVPVLTGSARGLSF
jgi:hypothetical protein